MNATLATSPSAARDHHRAPQVATTCWCGQDLDHVRRTHCPRCGRTRPRRAVR